MVVRVWYGCGTGVVVRVWWKCLGCYVTSSPVAPGESDALALQFTIDCPVRDLLTTC